MNFWKAVPSASSAIENAEGVQYFKGIGEWPFVQQATLSIWNSVEDVKKFAYKNRTHSNIIKKLEIESGIARICLPGFHILSDTGFINNITPRKMNKAIVIGAGIGGIASALRLTKKGYKVTVFDSNNYPGGKITSLKLGKYRFDAGPPLLTMPNLIDDLFLLFNEDPSEFFNYNREKKLVVNIFGMIKPK